jgi:hypothetical protein
MCKKSLQGTQMSDGVYVERAAAWAKELTAYESRGPGDTENAWRRLEDRYGIPARTFWSLRYRPPKEIFVSLFVRIHTAYRQEQERQARKIEHELAITKAITGPDDIAVVATEVTLGEENEGKEWPALMREILE